MDKVFLPSPVDVVLRIGKWFSQDNLLRDIWISTYRVSAGWLLSALLALPLGLFPGFHFIPSGLARVRQQLQALDD